MYGIPGVSICEEVVEGSGGSDHVNDHANVNDDISQVQSFGLRA